MTRSNHVYFYTFIDVCFYVCLLVCLSLSLSLSLSPFLLFRAWGREIREDLSSMRPPVF